MPAPSNYSGFTVRYGTRYKNKRIGQVTNVRGDTVCPYCKKAEGLRFIDEHVQMGFVFNKYMEFNWCDTCSKGFCLVMVRSEDSYE